MGKSLTDTPRGTFADLAQWGDPGDFPEDGETPLVLLKGDGTESPISCTKTKVFVNGVEVGAGGVQNNYEATAEPGVNDDAGEGYAIGSLWIDTVAGEAYRCVDVSEGAAVWIESTLDPAEVTALINATIGTATQAAINAEAELRIAGDVEKSLVNPYSGPVLPITTGKALVRTFSGAETPFRVRQLVLGDSYAVTVDIERYYTPTRERGFGPNPILGGGATTLGDQWTRTPAAGRVHRLNGSGQTVQFPTEMYAYNVRVFYNTESGGGTFALETSTDGGAWTEVPGATTASPLSADNGGAVSAAVFSYNFTGTKSRKVRAKWVSGTVYILGFVLSDINDTSGTRGGSAVHDFSQGGIIVANNALCPASIWTVILDNLKPDFVTIKSDDDYSTYSLETLYDLINGVRVMDWIFFGQHPRNAFPTNEPNASDILLRALAEEKKQAYFESRAIFQDFEAMKAAGFARDGDVHLTASGGVFERLTASYRLGDGFGAAAALSRNREGVKPPTFAGGIIARLEGAGFVFRGTNLGTGNAANASTSYGVYSNGATKIFHTYGSNDFIRQYFDGVNTVFLGGSYGGGNHVSPVFTRSGTGYFEFFTGNATNGRGLVASTGVGHTGSAFSIYKDATFTSAGTEVARFSSRGKQEGISSGSAPLTGAFSLIAGVATINTTAVATNDHIDVTIKTPGGTMGTHYKVTIVNATSLTITAIDTSGATVTTDTSTGTWAIGTGRI